MDEHGGISPAPRRHRYSLPRRAGTYVEPPYEPGPPVPAGPDPIPLPRRSTREMQLVYLMRMGAPGAEKAVGRVDDETCVALSDVAPHSGAPLMRPHEILRTGLDHRDDAAEGGMPVAAEPILFVDDARTKSMTFDLATRRQRVLGPR